MAKNKHYKYDPTTRQFYSKDNKNGKEVALGGINTRRGGLSRSEKLFLIRMNGEWVLL